MKYNNNRVKIGIIGGTVIVIVAIGMFILSKQNKSISNSATPVTSQNTPTTNFTNISGNKDKLLTSLKSSVDAENYTAFGDKLNEVYKNSWQNDKDFQTLESALYVTATKKYFDTGNYTKALEVSTIVYKKISEPWRFRYLRIRTLEKLGRIAFNKGDLKTAEAYANQILQMIFRLEGTNLLADIYIQRIENNLKNNNISLAKKNLDFIWDYEVSQDRRTTLNNLKIKLDALK